MYACCVPESVRQARVKGLAFRSVVTAVESLAGMDTVARAFALMPIDLAHGLRYGSIVASSWYPIVDYQKLWEAVHEAAGRRRDFPRMVGRKAIQHDLGVVHKLVLSALSTSTVMSLSTRLFNSYYDTGTASAKQISGRTIRVQWVKCTGWTALMWAEARGSTEMLAELAGWSERTTSIVLAGGGDRDEHMTLDVNRPDPSVV
jgi:hypothetical protein